MNKEFQSVFKYFIRLFSFSFITFILLSLIIWFFSGYPGTYANLMITIEAISTAIAAAAAIAGGYAAYMQYIKSASEHYNDTADRLFEELNSPENIEARRRIFQNLKPDPEQGMKRLKKEDREAMKQVLNSLDRVAFITQQGWVPDEMIMPWMHPMIAKSWEKLEPYVLYERKRRNEPYYYEHAGELAGRCRKWRARHLAETTTKWTDDAL